MRRAILGTAGHIDHGKTSLVHALTGVDTDRLPEEKARGITIELGFAELTLPGDIHFGVVDVPGHEDFIRTMVAGATGMDVVLLTVAADEGVMPQTREHLDIVAILGVPSMVVALTKVDSVEAEWLDMVREDVREFLGPTPYANAPVVATSARTGEGLDTLRAELGRAAANARVRASTDAPRLPVDRAFTVAGRGTVVTGTLWSGALAVGDKVRLLPSGLDARIRSLQVHGRDTPRSEAGARTAVALAGVDRSEAARGQTLVGSVGWEPSWMLTARLSLLAGGPRGVEHGSRVRVLLGTAEVMARCAVLEDGGAIPPGESGWVQLRLEEPAVVRNGDPVVVRSYSPMVTLGGGVVAEPVPPKRRFLSDPERRALDALLGPQPTDRVAAALTLSGWTGVAPQALVQTAGLAPGEVQATLASLEQSGALSARGLAFSSEVAGAAAARMLAALEQEHARDGLRAAVPLERLRSALPTWAAAPLADAVLTRLQAAASIELAEGGARRPGFRPVPTPDQASACRLLQEAYAAGGLAPPFVTELPEPLLARADLPQLLRYLEDQGVLRTVDDGLLFDAEVLRTASESVSRGLAGRTELGPADFREILPVSRRHLMPLLAFLDGEGVTVRRGPTRDVPALS